MMNDGAQIEQYRVGDLILDVGAQTVFRNGQEIELPKLSFDLLVTLVRHAPRVVGLDELMKTVWGEVIVSDETVTQRVKLLRNALGSTGAQPHYIATVRARGYKLIAPVEPLTGPASGESKMRRWPILAWLGIGLAGILVVALVLWWLPQPQPPPLGSPEPMTRAVAVLPFNNISPDPSDDYLGEGIAEEILNAVAKIQGLRVAARTSAFALAEEKDLDIPAIARVLNVDMVLEGSVRRAGNRIRITTQLVDVTSGYHIWTQAFDRELTDIFAIQAEVASAVAEKLELSLLPKTPVVAGNVMAYERYLLGRHELRRSTEASTETAIGYFQEAIDIDPDYAPAYAGAAYAHLVLSGYGLHGVTDIASSPLKFEIMTYFDPTAVQEAFDQAAVIAQPYLDQALTLNPELPETHVALGLLRMRQGDLDGAQSSLKKALALNPNSPRAHQLFGLTIRKQHRYRESLPWLQRAFEIDPLSPDSLIDLATTLSLTGQEEAAEVLFMRLIELEPEVFAYRELGYHFVRYGKLKEAYETWIALLEVAPDYLPAVYDIARIYWTLGDASKAEQWIERLVATRDDSVMGRFFKGGGLIGRDFQYQDYESAAKRIDALRQELGDLSFLLFYAAVVEAGRGDFVTARDHFEAAGETFRHDPTWPFTINWFWEGYPVLDSVLQGFLYLGTDDELEGLIKIKESQDFIEALWEQGWSVGVTTYVAAQIYALELRRGKAVQMLERAYEEGWRDYNFALNDPVLKNLRKDPEFQALMARMQADATEVLQTLR